MDHVEHSAGTKVHQKEVVAIADPALPRARRPKVIIAVIADVIARRIIDPVEAVTDAYRPIAPIAVGGRIISVAVMTVAVPLPTIMGTVPVMAVVPSMA
jgi:hypothetical protein